MCCSAHASSKTSSVSIMAAREDGESRRDVVTNERSVVEKFCAITGNNCLVVNVTCFLLHTLALHLVKVQAQQQFVIHFGSVYLPLTPPGH